MHFKPPMTMMDFFAKSEGIWFIERNVHHFDVVANESGDSNLIVDIIPPDSPKVEEVCALQDIDPKMAQGGASFRWMATTDEKEPNANYAAILIDIPDDETGITGKLIRNKGYVEGIPVIGRYWFGKDGILTINTDYDNNQGQERAWFVTDDFRVRVSTTRMMNGVNLTAYCSERRCVSPEKLEAMLAKHNGR
ncbi:MAG: phycobiliprotein lyase [Xenococcaceae cyanobacterium MO_167.B27]|nr:phycobiliprotein lyase [Xenococcaceae cyanobacterium MO_167.B27]